MGLGEIDLNLLEAWQRIGAQCRADRLESLRRFGRRSNRTLVSPPRAACLCIRASDRRLSPATAAIEFEPETVLQLREATDEAVERGVPHLVELTGELVRTLTQPIMIPWPGIDWKKAAKRCGISPDAMRRWIKAGTVVVECRARVRARGPLVPFVYTPSPIDPNHVAARPPDPIWGTLWQAQCEELPDEFLQLIKRVPRFADRPNLPLVGWDWICPGRRAMPAELDAADQEGWIACGRRCRRLYGPIPVWTLPGLSCVRHELEMPEDSQLKGTWHPGEEEIGPRKGERSFACKHCWNVRSVSLVGEQGWNSFVSYLSGGLLYGHEVARPLTEAPHRRRVRPYRQHTPAKRPCPRRDMVLEGLMRGETHREIAERLGMKRATVKDHVRKMYKRYNVHSRAELIARIRTNAANAM